jgi:hypothetical protein
MKNPLYLECACYYCRLMRVEYDPEFGETFISMWSRPISHTWRTRLRHIWKILRGGEPFEDEIILNRECMAKLSGYLMKSIELDEIIEEYYKLKRESVEAQPVILSN